MPHTEDIERLVVRIAEACDAWQARQGFGAEDEADDADADDAQAVIQHASLLGPAALSERAGKRARRVQGLGCGGSLTLWYVVVNPPATRRILDGLRRATGPPGPGAGGDDRKA